MVIMLERESMYLSLSNLKTEKLSEKVNFNIL